jgi:hypothetical protein
MKLGKAKDSGICRGFQKSGGIGDAELVSEYAGARNCEIGCVNHLLPSPLIMDVVAGLA